MKAKPLVKPPAREPVRVEALSRFAKLSKSLKSRLAFPKSFKSAVVVDKSGSPRYFVFDTYSLWDLLCAVDTAFEERTPDNVYVFDNPVGGLIDVIESHLPLDPDLVAKLKGGLEEAKSLGTIPFETVERRLGLR